MNIFFLVGVLGQQRIHFVLEPWSVVRSISGLRRFSEVAPVSGCPLREGDLKEQKRNSEGQRMGDLNLKY